MIKFQMRVSILLPFKNAAPWIQETIESILSQSYTNWEIIAVNDNSEDTSEQLLINYKDERIRVLSNEESGIIPALQLGLQTARGAYLTRMDADDIMPPNRIEKMVSALTNAPEKSIVTGKVKYFSAKEVSRGYLKYEHWLNTRIENQDHYKHIYRECVVASPNWLGRTKEFIENGIFDLEYPEDYDMTFQWLSKGFKIVSIPEVTLMWREHPERTSRNSEVYDQASFFRLKLKRFLELNDLKERRLAIFGAGPKGKITANFLKENDIEFGWYDQSYQKLKGIKEPQKIEDPSSSNESIGLLSVYPDNLEELKLFLEGKNYTLGENAWFL